MDKSEADALRRDSRAHIAAGHTVTDEALVNWKRGRGCLSARDMLVPAKRRAWLAAARAILGL